MQLNDLKVEKLFNENYILLEDFKYQVGKLVITVPKGFVTDFASIPKMLWGLLPKHGKYDIASVVHDFLYSEHNLTGINRKLADKIFNYIMKESGVNCYTRKILYLGVRKFGKPFYKDLKLNGLKSFEDEVTINNTKEAKEYYGFYKEYLGF